MTGAWLRTGFLALATASVFLLPGCSVNAPRVDVKDASSPSYEDLLPRYSPDGSQIAFESDRAGQTDILVMDADGSNVQRLTSTPDDELDPAWSPDGRTIVFDAAPAGFPQLFTVEVSGGPPRAITADPDSAGIFPAWSPDGRWIAYACGSGIDALDICAIRPDGTGFHTLTDTPDAREWEPAWSPDGELIAFVSDVEGNDEIFVMGADGSNVRRLTTSDGRDADPAWSPDGRTIAFDSDRAEGICFMSAKDGSNVDCPTAVLGAAPSWSPDGTRVAFHGQASPNDPVRIMVMNADGSGVDVLT